MNSYELMFYSMPKIILIICYCISTGAGITRVCFIILSDCVLDCSDDELPEFLSLVDFVVILKIWLDDLMVLDDCGVETTESSELILKTFLKIGTIKTPIQVFAKMSLVSLLPDNLITLRTRCFTIVEKILIA